MGAVEPKRQTRSFANGLPELIILRLVSQREMYGYELMKAMETATDHRLSFAEGHIYPLLHVMEADGHLASSRREVRGKTRLYYRVTPKGRKRLEHMVGDWTRVKTGMEAILKPVPS